MVVGFEMMGSEAGAGVDLKRISELKFKESLENSYRSREKRRRVCVPPTAKPRHTASPGRQGTWPSPTLSALRRSRLVTDSKRTEFFLPETTGPRHTASFGRTDTLTTTAQSLPERSSLGLGGEAGGHINFCKLLTARGE